MVSILTRVSSLQAVVDRLATIKAVQKLNADEASVFALAA